MYMYVFPVSMIECLLLLLLCLYIYIYMFISYSHGILLYYDIYVVVC